MNFFLFVAPELNVDVLCACVCVSVCVTYAHGDVLARSLAHLFRLAKITECETKIRANDRNRAMYKRHHLFKSK